MVKAVFSLFSLFVSNLKPMNRPIPRNMTTRAPSMADMKMTRARDPVNSVKKKLITTGEELVRAKTVTITARIRLRINRN